MFDRGRFAAAMEFGLPGRGSNHMMPLFINMPVRGRVTFDPNSDNSVIVSATRFPWRSATLMWVVQDGEPKSGTSPMKARRWS